MYIKRKKNRSGTISVVIAEKNQGQYRELITIGVASNDEELKEYETRGQEWIVKEMSRRQPRLDLFGEESKEKEEELKTARRFISQIKNITINGADIILDKVFASIGFDRIEDNVFP